MYSQYQPSGRIGLMGIPAMLVGGLGAAFILGAVYAYAVAWIPLIYFCFIATLLYGGALGVCVNIAATLGKVRNVWIARLAGFGTGLAGLYVAWAWDGVARLGSEFEPGVAWNPLLLIGYISFFFQNGLWEISGNAVTGWPLVLIWTVEAGAILWLSTTLSSATAQSPFCESCQSWTDDTEGLAYLAPPQNSDILVQLSEGNLEALSAFETCSSERTESLRLDVALCPECSDTGYLTIQMVKKGVDKDGDVTVDTTELVSHMELDAESRQLLTDTVDALPASEEPVEATDETADATDDDPDSIAPSQTA